jgi:hypothetical protein
MQRDLNHESGAELAAGFERMHNGSFGSSFSVTEFAVASIGTAAMELAELVHQSHGVRPNITVDSRLASYWFLQTIRPQGWELPPAWDAIAGDYQTSDGWIRLHTNAPHHREAALTALGVSQRASDGSVIERTRIAELVAGWNGEDLETAVVASGGCAAQLRDAQSWARHAQGSAVNLEKLIDTQTYEYCDDRRSTSIAGRPLQGIRILDLTRILAGPVATRFLAGYGAEVLRIDPPMWDEPSLAAEVTLGKRCARLDLSKADERAHFEQLLREADVLVHGYRADALERLGLGESRRRELCPDLVDVSLNAYGRTGPWCDRRGFDSLVQMSSGIAHRGMVESGANHPVPLPAQALDHATGYLMAASVINGLRRRRELNRGSTYRLSLARTASMLIDGPAGDRTSQLASLVDHDYNDSTEATPWGPARRLRSPVTISGAPQHWDLPTSALGSSSPTWSSANR